MHLNSKRNLTLFESIALSPSGDFYYAYFYPGNSHLIFFSVDYDVIHELAESHSSIESNFLREKVTALVMPIELEGIRISHYSCYF